MLSVKSGTGRLFGRYHERIQQAKSVLVPLWSELWTLPHVFKQKLPWLRWRGRESVMQDRKVQHGTWRSRILLSMQGVPM